MNENFPEGFKYPEPINDRQEAIDNALRVEAAAKRLVELYREENPDQDEILSLQSEIKQSYQEVKDLRS